MKRVQHKSKMIHVSQTLNLPDHLIPLTVLSIGKPAEEKDANYLDKYEPEKIYRNRYAEK